MKKINMSIVETGTRDVFFFKNLLIKYRANIIGLCDKNKMRLGLAKKQIGNNIQTFIEYNEFLKLLSLEAGFWSTVIGIAIENLLRKKY